MALVKLIDFLRRSLARSLAKRGVVGTVRFAAKAALYRIGELRPSHRRTRASRKRADIEFDRKYGVDTGGRVHLAALDIDSPSWIHGGAYEAVGPVDFGKILGELKAPMSELTFIDLGSGKGRAVLLASTLPFKRVVGVEISHELTSTAIENLRRFPDHARRCRDVHLVCEDAARYVFPDEPLVLFMYNPFDRPIMARVIENLSESYESHRRRIIVLYLVPRLAEMWDRAAFVGRKHAPSGWAFYDTDAQDASGAVGWQGLDSATWPRG